MIAAPRSESASESIAAHVTQAPVSVSSEIKRPLLIPVIFPAKAVLRSLRDICRRRMAGQVFGTPVIVHWGMHKAMTGYYSEVMLQLRKKTGLHLSAFYDNTAGLGTEIRRISALPSSIVLLSDLLDIRVPSGMPYLASRTLRDPRDLVVSGYFYHKKSPEPWLLRQDFDWEELMKDPAFERWFDRRKCQWTGLSFATVLQSLNRVDGLALEIVRLAPVLRRMERMDVNDERVLQINFEEILNHEVTAFRRLFAHYQLKAKYLPFALETVERLSVKARGENHAHIRAAECGEWHSALDDSHKELVNTEFRAALLKGGYIP